MAACVVRAEPSMTAFAELVAATNFSFLRGASHAHEMVGQAAELGLAAIGIADRNTLAGVVRAHTAAKEHSIRLLVGARLVTTDGFEAACYPTDRAAYGRLCRLLTSATAAPSKASAILLRGARSPPAEGQIFIVLPPRADHAGLCRAPRHTRRRRARPRLSRRHVRLRRRRAPAPRRAGRARPRRRARRSSPPTTPIYHHPGRKPLADVLACIREKCTIARSRLPPRGQRRAALKPAAEMARLFARYPQAVARSLEIAGPHPLRSGRAALRIPRRAGAAGQDPAGLSGGADLGARRPALSRRRSGQGARAPRQGAGADRPARLRPLFPHRLRHRALRPQRSRRSCARAAARPPTARCASASASPASTPPRSTCCSSASSPPTAASRPTSTSTSSTSGARR